MALKFIPALGYYPFDEDLLILWKYAADRQLPITTHAIRGTVFYRGTKKKEWGYHPVFTQSTGRIEDPPEPLYIPELKNVNYINNYHASAELFMPGGRAHASQAGCAMQERNSGLFWLYQCRNSLKHNLSHLKLCFGHYGGDDEWKPVPG
jgi:hypothetical protein